VLEAIFATEEFVERTAGAVRRTAIERYVRSRAVRDVPRKLLENSVSM
jgi:hypothetical protein